MMFPLPIICASVVCVCLLQTTTLTAQVTPWKQFRSDTQNDLGDLALPIEWDSADAAEWSVTIPGLGHSSPVHDGRTIWLTTAAKDGSWLSAVSIDAESGRTLKEIELFRPAEIEEIHHDNSYASPTPVLADGKLICHFGTYGTACVDTATGEILWRNNDFPVEHQGGPGSSPVVYQGVVILSLDGAQKQRMVALQLSDGSVAWERARSAPFRENPITHRAFSTPLITTFRGQPQLISPAADQIHAYHPASGDELWHVRYVGFSTVPCPVANAERVFFLTGFFKPECWAVDLDGEGDVTESHVAWKFKGPMPDTPSPLLVGKDLYLLSNKGILTCVEAETGQRQWVFRVGGNYSASPLHAHGHLYVCSEEGLVKVLKLTGDKPVLATTNKLDERIMASPVVLGDDLLIRTETKLYRISSD